MICFHNNTSPPALPVPPPPSPCFAPSEPAKPPARGTRPWRGQDPRCHVSRATRALPHCSSWPGFWVRACSCLHGTRDGAATGFPVDRSCSSCCQGFCPSLQQQNDAHLWVLSKPMLELVARVPACSTPSSALSFPLFTFKVAIRLVSPARCHSLPTASSRLHQILQRW